MENMKNQEIHPIIPRVPQGPIASGSSAMMRFAAPAALETVEQEHVR
jgi:hypothetical protein